MTDNIRYVISPDGEVINAEKAAAALAAFGESIQAFATAAAQAFEYTSEAIHIILADANKPLIKWLTEYSPVMIQIIRQQPRYRHTFRQRSRYRGRPELHAGPWLRIENVATSRADDAPASARP